MQTYWCLQIQTELGDSHINIVNALEVIVTSTNLALVLEYAQGGSLTHYVGQRWQHAQHTGSFLSEDESRYLFRVRSLPLVLCGHCKRSQAADKPGLLQQFISAVEYCHQHNVAHRCGFCSLLLAY